MNKTGPKDSGYGDSICDRVRRGLMKPLSELNRSLRAVLGCAFVLYRLGGLGGLAGQLLCVRIDQNTTEMFWNIGFQGRDRLTGPL